MKQDRHYQVIVSKYEDEQHFAVHEAFTDEFGNIQGITDYPVTVQGESIKEIKEQLSMINYDINKYPPILDKDVEKVLSGASPESEIDFEEYDSEEDYDFTLDTDEDLVDIFKRGY